MTQPAVGNQTNEAVREKVSDRETEREGEINKIMIGRKGRESVRRAFLHGFTVLQHCLQPDKQCYELNIKVYMSIV